MDRLSLEELKTYCADLSPMLAESHFRRFVARHNEDLRAWTILIGCLIRQRNHTEARYTIDRFLQLHGGQETAKRFAIAAYFEVGAHAEAYRVSQKLADRQLADNGNLTQVLTLLSWLYDADDNKLLPAGTVRDSLSQKLDKFNYDALPVPRSGIEVGFFLKYGWHHSIQQQVASHLRQEGVCCMFLRSIWAVVAARPRVLAVSDSLGTDRMVLREHLPDCRIVYTRHGLGDKNYASYAAGNADVTCVSGPAVAREFAEQFVIDRARFWVTGYPQMDRLFRHLANHPSPPGSRTVLVAPTFTKGMNAGEILGERLVESVRGSDESIRVMIRPHPHWRKSHAALVQAWAEQAARLPGVSLHDSDEISLMDLFESADMMVSDVSSAGLAWLATGRPLVCVADTAKAQLSPFYAPDGLEWRMHQAAECVDDARVLPTIVQNALNAPTPPNAAYQALRHHLFGDLTDGRASARIAAHIKRWLEEDFSR